MEDVSDRCCRPRSMFSGILRQATLPPPESPVFSTRPRLVYRFRFASRFRSPLFFLPLLLPLCFFAAGSSPAAPPTRFCPTAPGGGEHVGLLRAPVVL